MELKVKTVRYFKGIQETQEGLLREPAEARGASTSVLGSAAAPVSVLHQGPTAVLPHGVPGSTKAGLDASGRFVLRTTDSARSLSPVHMPRT